MASHTVVLAGRPPDSACSPRVTSRTLLDRSGGRLFQYREDPGSGKGCDLRHGRVPAVDEALVGEHVGSTIVVELAGGFYGDVLGEKLSKGMIDEFVDAVLPDLATSSLNISG